MVKANQNIVEVYKEEFDSGTRTFVDILNAQIELYQSQQNLVNREFALLDDYWTILFNLSSLGKTVLSSDMKQCIKPIKKAKAVIQNSKEIDEELKALVSTVTEESKSAFDGIYTINLAVFSKEENAKKFLESLTLKEETRSYKYSNDKLTKIIYGSFSTKEEAIKAMMELPQSVKKNKPYINLLQNHKAYLND